MTGECAELPWDMYGSVILKAEDREDDSLTCNLSCWPEFAFEFFQLQGPCDNLTLHLAKNIDVDREPWMQSINLTAEVEDEEGLKAIAYISLTFYDINDKVPQFTEANYTHYLDGMLFQCYFTGEISRS